MTYIEYIPWAIALLTFMGASMQIFAIIGYNAELKNIKRLTNLISDLMSIESWKPKKPEDLLEKAGGVKKNSMAGSRTIEVEAFSEYTGMVALHDLGAVAAEADAGKIRNSVPGVLIASLLVLGLFGTLFSLKLTLQNPSFLDFFEKDGTTTVVDFNKALIPIIKGFGEAFKASIFGVGGTIFLIFVRVFVRARRESCFESLERYAVESLLPYYIEPEKTTLENAANTLDKRTAKFENVARLMDDSCQIISASISNLKDATEQAKEVFGEEGPIVYRLREFAKAANVFNNNAGNIAKTNERVSSSLDISAESNSRLLQRLGEWNIEQVKRQDELTETFNELVDTVTSASDSTQATFLAAISTLSESQQEVVKALDTSAQKQISDADTLTKAIASSYGKSLQSLNEENKKLIQMLSDYNEEQSTKNKTIQDNLLETLNSINTQITNVALKEDRIDIDAFNEFRKHLEQISSRLDEVIEANKEAIELSFKRHGKVDSKMMSSFTSFSNRVNTLSRTMDKIADVNSPEHKNFFSKIIKQGA